MLLVAMFSCSAVLYAQTYAINRVWYNFEKSSKIQIYKGSDEAYHGKIVWLRDPHDQNGKPRTDVHNPNENQRTAKLMNLVILKNFKQSSGDPNTFEGGTIYDPKTGKTYCGKITVAAKQLKLRGHICGWSWLGRSTTFDLAE